MIIVIEGIPGAGKTTITSMLEKELNAVIVPELLDTDTDYTKLSILEEEKFFLKNDIDKNILAQKFAHENKIVVMDRHYVSTLAYNYAATVTGLKNTYSLVLDWYLSSKKDKLVLPDIYIYLDVDVIEGIKRKGRIPNSDREWCSVEFITEMKHFYEYSFPLIDPLINKHIINSTALKKYGVLERIKELC